MDLNNFFLISLMAVILLFGASGCANNPTAVERDFGKSVRHMTQAQTLNPVTPSPAEAPTVDGDGDRLNKVIDAYRTDVSKPEDVKNDIVINLGE